LRVLFVTRPHLPRIGGAQLTTHAAARGLSLRGHEVTVLGEAPDPPAGELPTVDPGVVPYPVREHPDPIRELPDLLRGGECDVVVVEDRGHMAWIPERIIRAAGDVPTVMHFQMLGSEDAVAALDPGLDASVAVSEFIARVLRRRGAENVAVIPPAVDGAVLEPPRSRRVALLVNVALHKGIETVLALARLRPDIPFAVARMFHPREREDFPTVAERLAELPNVALRRPTADPSELYRDARVVLMPSLRPEGFGRVAAEADICGIPLIAARTGGIPEAAGRSALLLRPGARLAEWERALSAVWDDAAEYVPRARPAERPELGPDVVAAAWERHLADVVARAAVAPPRTSTNGSGPTPAWTTTLRR
jgi:glycosyltransferase involved in cell wall biosynthesis